MLLAPVNLAECPKAIGDGRQAHFISFWWNRLPIGAAAFAAAELPLSADTLTQMTTDLAARQLSARDPALGSAPCAIEDGKLVRSVSLAGAVETEDLIARLDRLGEPAVRDAAHVSVIVCTRDRLQYLSRCLDRLLQLASPPGEIIVVDNSSTGSAREIVAARPSLAYVHEPRTGLSVARNTGIQTSRGALIAFTDDDAEALPEWTSELVRAFDNPETAAVTGLVLPASLDTAAQQDFQFTIGAFGSDFLPVWFGQTFFHRSRPYGCQVWRIGAGANMAFRRSVLEEVGLFDERLGAGAAGCSEDSEIWYRILAAGGGCLFEPRIVVLHHHRADWTVLRRQVRAYMRGHVAALVAQYDRYGDAGNLKRIFGQLPVYLIGLGGRCLLEGRNRRLAILLEEAVGWLAGLTYVVRPRWRRMTALPRLARSTNAE